MKINHTPGPWEFAYGSVYRSDTLHDESSIKLLMADRNESHTEPTERDANCRLAAAAPELLEALQSLIATLANGHIPGCDEYDYAEQQAIKAIEKATL